MLRGVVFAALVVAACVAASVEAIIWRQGDSDDEIVRSLVLITSPPPLGITPNNLVVFAGRRAEPRSEGLIWHWTTNFVPRKAVLYYKRQDDDDDSSSTANEETPNEAEGESPSAAALFFRIALWKLVEFVDRDGDAGYQPVLSPGLTDDVSVNELRFWNGGGQFNTWSDMVFSVRDQPDGARPGSRVFDGLKLCTHMDRTTNPVLESRNSSTSIEICLQMAGPRRLFAGDSTETDPNAAKWSLTIRNWDWASPNSKLALKVSIDTVSAAADPDPETARAAAAAGNDALDVGQADDGAQALTTWVRTVDLTGSSCNATANVLKGIIREGEWEGDTGDVNQNENEIDRDDSLALVRGVQVSYFTIDTTCHPDSITWDPEFGIVTVDAATPTVAASVALVALILALFF